MSAIVSTLTIDERAKLSAAETRIETGLKTFWQVGAALAQVRDGKLYRDTHKTFEDYCIDRWRMRRPTAYQFIGAAEVHENLSAIADKLPTRESHARPLSKLPVPQQRQAWLLALSSGGGRPTADDIKAAARRVIRDDPTLSSTPPTLSMDAGVHQPAHTPAKGLQCAEMAILDLEKIMWHDRQLVEALRAVIDWATQRLDATPQQPLRSRSIRFLPPVYPHTLGKGPA